MVTHALDRERASPRQKLTLEMYYALAQLMRCHEQMLLRSAAGAAEV